MTAPVFGETFTCIWCHGKRSDCLACGGTGLTQFAPQAVARNTDPSTSREAAKSLSPSRITGDRKLVLELLREIGPATDERLWQFERIRRAMTDSGARTRRSELVREGLVEDSGRKEKTVSGHPAIVWRAVR